MVVPCSVPIGTVIDVAILDRLALPKLIVCSKTKDLLSPIGQSTIPARVRNLFRDLERPSQAT